jgi:xyloglucan-specific exo-beta-1,4-glucanase
MLTTKLPGYLTILAVLFFLPAVARPQRVPDERGGEHNFYEIQRRYNAQLEARRKDRKRPPRGEELDDEEVKFRRFETFWAPRVDEKGDFSSYYKNLKTASESLGCDTCGAVCNRANWIFMGPSTLPTQNMGAILSVWVNPNNPSEILAGTWNTGLYKTTGAGNWTKLTNFGCRVNCPDFPQGGVSSIAVDPKNTDVIYITVAINRGVTEQYSLGVYKTTNGGLTWCPTDLQFDPLEYVGNCKVVMDPNDSNTLYATGRHKVYKTTDGGATWKSNVIFTAQNYHEIQDIAVSRNSGSAGLYFSEGPERCYSNTGCPTSPWISGWSCPIADGKIWYDPTFNGTTPFPTDITSQALGFYASPTFEVRLEKALFSVTPNSVSILALSDAYHPAAGCYLALNADTIIARNTNNAPAVNASWTQHINPSWTVGAHGAAYGTAFAVSPLNDNLVMIGSDHGSPFLDDLYVSNMGGGQPTLNLNKDCLHADLRALAFSRKVGADEIWIVGNDGGVSEARVNATGVTPPCVNLNGSGLTVTDFFGISNSETDPSKIYAGSQDNGIFDTTTGTWHRDDVGDAYDAVTDVTNPLKTYAAASGWFINTSDGISWSWGLPFALTYEPHRWNTPMVIDKSNALYIGQRNVWRAHPGAAAATPLSSNWTVELRALHVPALNSSTIIAARDGVTYGAPGEKILRTDTAHYNATSASWINITYNLPIFWQVITGITSDEKADNVWVGMGNFGRHVLLLKKGSTTWEDYSDGLPQLPVNVIKYWEGSGDDSLFVGTDTGVYYRNRNMSEWKRISCRLPNILVSDLEINNRTQKVRVATRGGGVWEASLSAIKNQGCTSDAYLAASYISWSGPATKDLPNNSTVTDAAEFRPITLTPKRVCCVEPCEIVANYTWTVYRVWYPSGFSIPVGSGQNSPVTFSPDFYDGWWWWHRRYNYRVEVTGSCGDKSCPPLTVHFNRW